MPDRNIPALVRRYYGAYADKDRSVLEAGLTEDFRFSSQYDDRIDRATYFERCWPNSVNFHTIEVERVFEQGDEAVVRYKATLNSGKEFRNLELVRFVDGKIAEVDVYFGRTLKDAS